MTFKNLLKFSVVVFVFTMVLSSLAFGQTRYLNSTDGDDSYDGTSATHDSPTVGPKRTLTGAFAAFASGTTVYMTAGNYIYNQSGIGGGNDAAGYTLGTGANKSMTFKVTTYNSNSVVSLSTGPLVINCGTGTIAFQAANAGVQSVSFTGASMTFTSGTLDVSGITFNAGGGMGAITVTDGAFVGSPVYANAGIALTYNGTTSKTAGAELPATLASITLSQTATSTVTFNSAFTLGTTGGGITNTTTPSRNATFNGLVTLTSATGAVTSTINNSQNADTWTFAGGVTVNSSAAANGNVITNSGTGTVAVSGALTFTQKDAAGTNDGNNTSTVQNTGTGTLNLTGGVLETPTASGAGSNFTASRTSVVNFSNAAAGTGNVGGGSGTTFTGTFITGAAAGTVNLTGPVTVNGGFTNGAGHTVALGANNLTLKGAIANGGTISSAGVGSGYVIIAANSTDATGGSWPNIRNTATGGAYAITTSATLSGNVENTASSNITILGAATITGGISLSGSGNITLGAGATNVNGSVSVTGTGTFTTTVTTIGGSTTISSGGITLGGNVTLMGAYIQNGGNLNFGGAFTLDVKNNFTRNTGTVTQATGTLQFSAGGSQTFSGGTNLEVWNFGVTGVGTGVTFVNGSLMVDNNATIVSNTNVILGSYNIRMEGLNAPIGAGKNVFSNAGQYTSTGGGGVIFENPSSGAASVGYLTGNGVNSNIEIRLANETDFIEVSAGTVVTWSGLLTLTRGTILVTGAGAQLNPSTTLTVPTIQRNLGDGTAPAGPDGKPITLAGGGVFNATNVSYNLTYYNLNPMVAGGSNVGPEFVVGASARVINFTDNATGQPVKLPAAGFYKFSGNLTIANSAEVQLGGALGVDDLVSTGTGVTHTIIGLLSRTGTATFSLVGDGTINGGTNTTAPADASTIADLTVNTSTTSATYNINSLKMIGVAGTDGLTLNAGTVNLGMLTYGAGPTIGSVRNATVNAGALNLTANATLLVNFTINGGTFDFTNKNLYANNAGIATVAATGGAFAATGATTGGYLVYSASGNLNTGTILVPRIMIANGSTLTLTGNSGVSDIFTDYDATPTAGTLTVGANTFVIAGGTWNAIGTYTAGAGKIQVTGATNINLGASITVPNFELKNTTNTANLVNNTGGAVPPSLTVGTLFTSTSGNLNLNACDVILTNAGVAFSYAAGTFTAATSNTITASDNANGEFVFNNAAAQTFNVTATGLVFPNVRIAGAGTMTLAAAPNNNAYTISKRLVIASTGSLTNGANSKVTFGDGALIKRMNNLGVLTETPVFAGAIDNQYTAAAGPIVQAKEAPATIRNLYVNNAAGVAVSSSKSVTVTNTLYLYTGNYDFEAVGGTIYTITMGANSTVNVRDGNLINSGSATVTPLAGGPVTLTYSNTLVRATTGREYPSTAAFVSTLNVLSDDGVGGAAKLLTLGANRSCGDFVLNTDASVPSVTGRFDLNANTLSVTNATSATLTRGILSSEAAAGGVWTYANLAVTGALTSTANASIQNVNVTAGSLTLAGPFGQTDWDGAGGNVLVGVTGATVSGTSAIAAFNGNLTSTGTVTINGAHSGGTITASADVTVAAGGSMAASSNLAFVGTANATLTVPAAGATIGAITFSKTNNTNTVTLASGNLTATALTTFVNGLFLTGSNTFSLWVPAFGGGQGFTRAGVTGTNISHVVGNVAKKLWNGGGNPGTACEPRQEFPVGNMTQYKPVAVTFNAAFGLATVPNTTLTVYYTDANPNGAVGLPIKDGVATGIDVSKYPNFYWTIASTPFSVGPTTPFDLELTATGFTNFDDVNNIRILRRHGLATDVTNQWLLQGTNDSYDNSVNAGVPTIIQRGANAGLRVGGAVFTLGLKSNMKINPNSGIVKYINTYKKLWLVLNQGVKGYNISDLVTGNIGSLTFVANSSNNSIAAAAAAGSTLQITPVAVGDVVVTVIAQDLTYNDFFAYSINVNVGLTDVQTKDELPTEFALFQNYPNPFNPTTNIKFDLPKESNVTLKIYNILGEEVATLVNKVMPAGHQVVTFDASRLASGMYIYRIQAGNFVSVKKMLLMK